MNYTKRSIKIEGISLERYFAPYEEGALKLVEPYFYLSTSVKDTIYAYHTLQKSFHVLLRKFLKVRREDFILVTRKEIASCRYLTKLLDPATMETITTDDPAVMVCATYSILRNLKLKLGVVRTKVREFDIPYELETMARENPSRHYNQLRVLKSWIAENLSEYVSLFIVHGSFATGDFYEGWSDLDTAVVLKDEAFSSPARLVEAREKLSRAGLVCYLVDPLAHHELMVFTAFDQEYYHEDTLPLSSYENGMLLYGHKHTRFIQRDSHNERLHSLALYAAWYRSKVIEEEWADNWYDWKNDISMVMIMPALAVEAKGEYPYKRESYSRAKELYPGIDWSIVDELSLWRKDWGARSWIQHLPVSLILASPYDITRRVLARLLRPVTHKRPKEEKEVVKNITHRTLELMENILKANL